MSVRNVTLSNYLHVRANTNVLKRGRAEPVQTCGYWLDVILDGLLGFRLVEDVCP